MRKQFKVETGYRLFFGTLVLLALYFAMPFLAAGGAMLGIMLPTGIDPSKFEDEDEKAFATRLSKAFKSIQFDGLDKEATELAIKSAIDGALKDLKVFKAEDIAKLVGMLDESKGVMAICKNLGIEMAALKEVAGKQGPKVKTFKSWFNGLLPEIGEVMKAKTGTRTFEAFIGKAAIMTTDNTTTGYDDLPDDVIESFSLHGFVEKRRPREYVFDLASVTTVAEVEQYIIWDEEGDSSGAFAVVAEGAQKPLVSYALVKNHSEASKVAGKYVVTEEFTKWRKRAYATIQRLIQQKMLRDYAAILTANLVAAAVPYTGSELDGEYDADKVTDYHAIAAVAAQIEALNFLPDMLVMNPGDKWRIGMSQDANGQFYLTLPVTNPNTGVTTIMGFQVRTSTLVPAGFFLLGESGLWEIIQESIKIKVGYGITVTGGADNGGGDVTNVSGDFDNNRFRIILETYFHDFIASNNTGSFVYAEFAVVKAAVTAV